MEKIFAKSHEESIAKLEVISNEISWFSEIVELYRQTTNQKHINFALSRTLNNHGHSIDNFFSHQAKISKKSVYSKEDSFHAQKVITALRIASLIEEAIGDGVSFNNGLDICCGAGIHAKTFAKIGLAKSFTGIDLVDRSSDCQLNASELIMSAITSLFTLAAENDFQPGYIDGSMHPHFFNQSPFTTHLNPQVIGGLPANINYMIGDFIQLDNYDQPFDLVTLYAGIEYFNLTDFYSKLSNITTKNAIFVTVNDYYWESQGTSMHLPTLPWLHAIAPQELYFKYIDSLYGNIGKSALEKMYYFGQNYATSSDHKNIALENGFELIYQRKVSTFKGDINILPYSFLTTYLSNYKELKTNNSSKLSDFLTYYLVQIYKKL